MSTPKRDTWRPDSRAKLFFSDSRPVAIPDELIPDGKLHAFIYNGETYGYIADRDDRGAFVMVTRTYRPPVRKLPRTKLRCIEGGKP